MAVSGRLVLLALVGVLLAAAAQSWAAFWTVDAVLLLLAAADLLLAGSVRGLRIVRSGDVTVRLGQTATVQLRVANPGPRRVRGVLRDAWSPSAGARNPRQPIDLPAGERRSLTVELVPVRRGDRVPDRVTVRAFGPL